MPLPNLDNNSPLDYPLQGHSFDFWEEFYKMYKKNTNQYLKKTSIKNIKILHLDAYRNNVNQFF